MRSWAFLLMLFVPAGAGATLLRPSTLEERLARADLVFVGRAVAERTVRVDGQVMTETRFAVRETLVGKASAETIVTHLGGREGALLYDVPGDPTFLLERDYLLITYAHRDGRRYLVSMGLGAFELEGERVHQSVDASLVQPSGVVAPGPIEASHSLAEVRRIAADLARRRAP